MEVLGAIWITFWNLIYLYLFLVPIALKIHDFVCWLDPVGGVRWLWRRVRPRRRPLCEYPRAASADVAAPWKVPVVARSTKVVTSGRPRYWI